MVSSCPRSCCPLDLVVPEPPPHLLVVGHVHDVHGAEGGVAPLGERFSGKKKSHIYYRNFVPLNFQQFFCRENTPKNALLFFLQHFPRPLLEHSSKVPTVTFKIKIFSFFDIFFKKNSKKMGFRRFRTMSHLLLPKDDFGVSLPPPDVGGGGAGEEGDGGGSLEEEPWTLALKEEEEKPFFRKVI